MRRLARAGFNNDFVSTAILPDWWESTCGDDPALLPDIEIRVARFLRAPIASIRDPDVRLAPPACPGVQLRRVRDIEHDRLAPAIHSALQVAAAAVRSLHEPRSPVRVPSVDALAWRREVETEHSSVGLGSVLVDCWQRGIPVVPIDVLPAPKFQAMACIVEDRPVVVLGHKYDEPGRVAFLIGHEIGHVTAGDCKPDEPVVDEEEAVTDNTDMERRADQYAMKLLVGSARIPEIDSPTPRDLAVLAARIEAQTGADAGAVIWSWARRTGSYPEAITAVKALYRAKGAQRLLREHFLRFVDLGSASESDRALLRSVIGEPGHDAPADR